MIQDQVPYCRIFATATFRSIRFESLALWPFLYVVFDDFPQGFRLFLNCKFQAPETEFSRFS